jgi:carbonic anhydrase
MENTMSTSVIDELIRRNGRFAEQNEVTGLSLLPSGQTLVLGCVDPRVDPAVVLGVRLGEAAVIRNLGGRVTPAALRTIALLGAIARNVGQQPGTDWNLVVVHHTDCGIARLVGQPDALAAELGIGPDALDPATLSDPRASLTTDLAALHANPVLPRGLIVSGLLYDVDTGRVETVVAAAPLGQP